MRRQRMRGRKDKRMFSKTAMKVQQRNLTVPMRGGIRL